MRVSEKLSRILRTPQLEVVMPLIELVQIVPAVRSFLQMPVIRLNSHLNRNNRNRKLITANDRGQRLQL